MLRNSTVFLMKTVFASLLMAKIRKKRNAERLTKAVKDAEYRKQLNHRNLLRVAQVTQDESRRLVKVFYRLPMNNLNKLDGLLSIENVIKLFVDINEAIVTLRKRKIYHGDIRPELICFDLADQAFVLLDRPFGNQNSQQLQKKKVMSGHKLFMSPQLFDNIILDEDRRVNSLKSEVFSLGMVILDIFFGDKAQEWYVWDLPEACGFREKQFREFVYSWKDLCKGKIRQFAECQSISTQREDFSGMKEEWVTRLSQTGHRTQYIFFKFFLFLLRRVLVYREKSRDFPTKVFSKVKELFSAEREQEIKRLDVDFQLHSAIVNVKEFFGYIELKFDGGNEESIRTDQDTTLGAEKRLVEEESSEESSGLLDRTATPKRGMREYGSEEKRMIEHINFGKKENQEIAEILNENNRKIELEILSQQQSIKENPVDSELAVSEKNTEKGQNESNPHEDGLKANEEVIEGEEIEEILVEEVEGAKMQPDEIELLVGSNSTDAVGGRDQEQQRPADHEAAQEGCGIREHPEHGPKDARNEGETDQIDSTENDETGPGRPEEQHSEPKADPEPQEDQERAEDRDDKREQELITDPKTESQDDLFKDENSENMLNKLISQVHVQQEESQVDSMTQPAEPKTRRSQLTISSNSRVSMKFKEMIDMHVSRRDSELVFPIPFKRTRFSKQLEPSIIRNKFKKFKTVNDFATETHSKRLDQQITIELESELAIESMETGEAAEGSPDVQNFQSIPMTRPANPELAKVHSQSSGKSKRPFFSIKKMLLADRDVEQDFENHFEQNSASQGGLEPSQMISGETRGTNL